MRQCPYTISSIDLFAHYSGNHSGSSRPVFGTYRLNGEVLQDAAAQAMWLFEKSGHAQLLDSAALYKNIDSLLPVLRQFPEAKVGWKLERVLKGDTKGDIKGDIKGDKKMKRSNHPKSIEWGMETLKKALARLEEETAEKQEKIREEEKQLKRRIGHRVFRVLLHNWAGLPGYRAVVTAVEAEFGPHMPVGICNVSKEQLQEILKEGLRVDYVQNEVHPFLKTEVPEICRSKGIQWVLTREAVSVIIFYLGFTNTFH